MKIYLYFYIGLTGLLCFGQNKELLYNFTDIPQSLLQNPGSKVTFNKHAGIPLFSQIHANAGTTEITLSDLFADNSILFNDKVRNALNIANRNDFITTTQQLELGFIGWRPTNKRTDNLYISAGAYLELDLITYIPKDIATFFIEGNRGFVNQAFKLSDLSLTAELLAVYHVGISKNVSNRLSVGARGKLYSSIFSIRSTNNRGTFTTIDTPDGNNFFSHQLRNVDVTIKTAGYATVAEFGEDGTLDNNVRDLAKLFLKRSLFGGNLGIGLDLGATYKLDTQWTLTGSLLDLGLIYYTKDTENYKAKGNYTFIGFEAPINPLRGQNVLEELEEAVPIDTLSQKYISLRPLKLNTSLSYAFNRKNTECYSCKRGEEVLYKDEVGIQLFSQFRPRRPIFAASLFYSKRISNLFHLKGTYTVDDYSFSNLGLLFSMNLFGFNFYLAGNHLLEYRNLANANAASVQVGFNIIL
ncbi:DUF5723 family protein [Aquimarina sp. ERC-38]|uniref:DUF5723 family protein n=1 Tax=Aquimarina sp. ERC-38 TaxID=2949996 RepID=UPI002245D81C|nr:DUF5723 family protein [Aquimarina sp. ERC-38]UZO80967.1 DUF5723 family protein [Aquimarina sp. ERC-38]